MLKYLKKGENLLKTWHQPNNQSTKPSVNQTINQPNHQPTKRSINQTTNQPKHQSTNPSIRQTINQANHQSTKPSIIYLSITEFDFATKGRCWANCAFPREAGRSGQPLSWGTGNWPALNFAFLLSFPCSFLSFPFSFISLPLFSTWYFPQTHW